jgi:hypothetical protein
VTIDKVSNLDKERWIVIEVGEEKRNTTGGLSKPQSRKKMTQQHSATKMHKYGEGMLKQQSGVSPPTWPQAC